MRIGLDARFLTHRQVGGFKTYTANLVRALVDHDTANEYVVYVDSEMPGLELAANPRVTWRIVKPSHGPAGMPWREQVSLRRQIARDRLDLVHFLCNTATLGLSTPVVVTVHDTIQLEPEIQGARPTLRRRLQSAYSRAVIRRIVRSASQVITVSEYERGRLLATLPIDAGRVTVVHQAADPIFTPLADGAREDARAILERRFGVDGPFLLGVGYEPRKNIPLLIETFVRLSGDHPTVRLVLVASDATGHYRARFAAQLAAAGLATRAFVLSDVSRSDMARLYALATLLVFPSAREGFGLPPLEAMACGTPVVASAVTSLPEVVGDAGVLVDSADASQWAYTVDAVLRNDTLRADLSQRALRRAAGFSWQRCAEQTLAAYARALAPAARPVGAVAAV